MLNKVCIGCDAIIVKRRRKSMEEWNKQKWCSRSCWYVWVKIRNLAVQEKLCGYCKRVLPIRSFAMKKKQRTWNWCCRECNCVINRIYQQNHPRKQDLHHGKSDPEKNKARSLLRAAVRRGKIKKLPCEVCGGKSEGHHDDYSRPYDVKWLCRTHHAMVHWKKLETPTVEKAYESRGISVSHSK